MNGAIRLGFLFALTLALSACSLICVGGQPALQEKPIVTHDVQLGSRGRSNE